MKHVTNTGQIVREAAPQPQQAAPVAVPAGVKVMTTWRNLKTGCEGMHEAGSLPREVVAQPGYEYGTAFLIPAADAQWAMRHLDFLRDRVGSDALRSLDCVRSWLNAWRVAASPQAAQAPTIQELAAGAHYPQCSAYQPTNEPSPVPPPSPSSAASTTSRSLTSSNPTTRDCPQCGRR